MDLSRAVVDLNPDGVIGFDREYRFMLWNAAMERISGLRRQEVIGRNAFEVFPFLREIGEDRHFTAALAGEISISRDRPYRIHQTGKVGIFDGHYIPLRADDGAIVGAIGLIREVTARHDAEALARESRELFESYMAHMPGVAFMKDSDGRHVYANRAFEETHGLGPREWEGKLDAEIFPPDTAARFRAHDLQVLEAGTPLRMIDEQGARAEPEHWLWIKFPFSDAAGRRLVAGLAFNITDQHRAEQALRASEERFRQLTENLQDIFYITNAAERRIEYVSPAFESICGRPADGLFADPEGYLELVHPEDRDRVANAICRQASGETTREEYRVVRPDGTIRHVMDRAVPVAGPAGDGGRVVGIVTDITERRRAEQALAVSEARFRAIFEQAPFSVQIVEPNGATVLANPAFETLWGVSRDVLRDYNLLLDPQVASLGILSHIKRALEGEVVALPPVYYDPAANRQPGRARWTEAVFYPVKDDGGAVRELVLMHRDVTDRVLIEQEREYLQAISEAALAHLGGDDVPAVAAERLREILGLDVTAVLLKSETGTFVVRTAPGAPHLQDVPVATASAACSLLAGAGFNGCTAVPLDVGGTSIGLLAVGRRIHPLGPDEERLLRTLAQRMALVIAHAELFAELQQANRRKDEFLATLGHELRNPLAPLLTAAELMRVHPGSDPALLHAQEVVSRQAQQMRRLIDDLLDVARITRGIVSLHVERIDIRFALTEAIQSARPMIDEREHELVVSLPEHPVFVDADKVRLEQIVTNLLSNAAKFTPRCGRIDVILEEEAGSATIVIADTGKGIPREMLLRVFDLFTQVNPSLDRAEGGLGLGLTLVKRLVEMHGGSVAVSSAGEGKGTRFAIRLPTRQEATDTKPASSADAAETSAAGCRVLIVDDNIDSADMLSLLLPGWGYVTETAHSGPDAIDRCAAFDPDIVLLDIGLPGMNGYEVARRLLDDPDRRRVPLIAITGYGQDEDRRRTREAGFAAHLTKPVDLDVLRGVLSALCHTGHSGASE